MSEAQARPSGRREVFLGCIVFAVIGAAAMLWMQGSGLTDPSKYHRDLTQAPHWVAYHGEAFDELDLLVRYASFNESPVQNDVYWVGTLLLDVVLLNKLIGVAVFGLTAALFFGLVSWNSGPWTGALAALFFIVFPRGAYEIAGGFSKAWAIGFVLLAVYVVETRAWRVLPWAMPLAALAYPVSPVLMGAIVVTGLLLEFTRTRSDGFRGLKFLCIGSALALIPLLYKYLTPPDFIGEMISSAEMRAMWASGESSSRTLPFAEEILSYFEHRFLVYGVIVLLIFLGRRGLVWKRSWTGLVVASSVCYLVADLVVPQLYLAGRYRRFSVAVLLVLWSAYNGSRALEAIPRPRLRGVALAALVVLAAFSFHSTFRPCSGRKAQGIWEDRSVVALPSEYIAQLPSPVLVAGHPYYTSGVMLQARQPVLVIHRMYHAWFRTYRAVVEERIQDTFRAIYARDPAAVNALAERYGVTHLLLHKAHYFEARIVKGRLYEKKFNEFINDLTQGRQNFVLNPPPRDTVVYEDSNYWLVELPLE